MLAGLGSSASSTSRRPRRSRTASISAPTPRTVLVFDSAAARSTCPVLMLSSGQSLQFRIGGDNFLGGDDFDNLRARAPARGAARRAAARAEVIAQLKTVAEDAKIAPSTTDAVAIDRFLRTPQGGAPAALSTEITREWFEQAARPLVERAMQRVEDVLAEAKLGKDKIHRVLMVGGCSRLPAVLDAVSALFGADKVDAELDGMLCVALGAAVRAAQLEPVAAAPAPGKSAPAPAPVPCRPRRPGRRHRDAAADRRRAARRHAQRADPRGHRAADRAAPAHLLDGAPNQTEVRLRFYEGHQPLARHNDHINDVAITLTKAVPKNTPVDITFNLDRNGIAVLSVAIADKLLLKDARIDRVIPADQLPPPAAPELEPSLDDVQYRSRASSRSASPSSITTRRSATPGAPRSPRSRARPASPRSAARSEAGRRMLDAGLPPHLWAYFNGHVMKAPSAEEQRAIESHVKRATEAAKARDTPRLQRRARSAEQRDPDPVGSARQRQEGPRRDRRALARAYFPLLRADGRVRLDRRRRRLVLGDRERLGVRRERAPRARRRRSARSPP